PTSRSCSASPCQRGDKNDEACMPLSGMRADGQPSGRNGERSSWSWTTPPQASCHDNGLAGRVVSAAPILVTGAAGFIGYHVARRLLQDGRTVVGLDNLNAYYDPVLKDARLAELAVHAAFRFVRLDLANREGMAALFAANHFPYVVHLG